MTTRTSATSIRLVDVPVVARIVSVRDTGDQRCCLRLTAPSGDGTRVWSRPAVLEVTINVPPADGSDRGDAETLPIAVRLEVGAGRVERAWGFFLGRRGAERRAVTPADALAWARGGVHGTVTTIPKR